MNPKLETLGKKLIELDMLYYDRSFKRQRERFDIAKAMLSHVGWWNLSRQIDAIEQATTELRRIVDDEAQESRIRTHVVREWNPTLNEFVGLLHHELRITSVADTPNLYRITLRGQVFMRVWRDDSDEKHIKYQVLEAPNGKRRAMWYEGGVFGLIQSELGVIATTFSLLMLNLHGVPTGPRR